MKKSISQWFSYYRIHLLFWLIFVLYETLLLSVAYHFPVNVLNYAIHYSATVLLFYTCSDFVMPWVFNNPGQVLWRFPLIMSILFGGFLILNFMLDILVIKSGIVKAEHVVVLDFNYCLKILYRWVYILAFSLGYYYLTNLNKARRRAAELENERLKSILKEERMMRALAKAQNDYLKAQINPHFLFNTLDYVYHNISIQNPQAADAIVTLADMMRYAIASNEVEEFILLGDEIEQVEKLIYLYRLRKPRELNILTDFSEEARGLQFIPLVILTLVENIFKHGNTTDQVNGVVIQVFVEDKQLKIETGNAVNRGLAIPGTHSGLHNIHQRLKFAYGDGVDFNYGADNDYFRVSITIPVSRILLQNEKRSRFEHHPN